MGECFSLVTRSGIFCCMSDGGRPRWLRQWSGAVFAALCAGAAFVAQTLPGEHLSPWTRWTITLGGAAATMVAVLLAARPTSADRGGREDAEQLAKAAVTDYHLILKSVLLPLVDIVDRIITAPNEIGQIEVKGAIKQAVVNSFVRFSDVPGARSCYFDYEHSGQEKKLVCRGIYFDWDSRPRTEFSSTDPNHAEIFQLLESRQWGLVEGVDIENPPRFPFKKRGYNAYIAVPVATSAEIFGLLTLDTIHVGDLNPQHIDEMLLLAQILGIALASGGSSRASANSTANERQRPTRPARSVTRRGDSTRGGGSIPLGSQGAVGAQLPWKPWGTRSGKWISAIVSRLAASRMTRSLRSMQAS